MDDTPQPPQPFADPPDATLGDKRSAGLLLVSDGRLLVVRRSEAVANSGRWGVPGGQLFRAEEPFDGAIREATEELGPLPPIVVVGQARVLRQSGPFDVYICRLSDAARAAWTPQLCHEHDSYRWSKLRWCLNRRSRLHGVLRALLDDPRALELIDMARVRGHRRQARLDVEASGRSRFAKTQ